MRRGSAAWGSGGPGNFAGVKVTVEAERLDSAIGENEVEPGVVKGGVGGVDDGVMVWAKEGKIFHGIRTAARAVPYVVGFGGVHGVNRGAVEAAKLASAGVKAVEVFHQLAVAGG